MAFRFPHTLTLLLALTPAPVLAQGLYQPVGVSDADALAQTMRRLGANPLDLDALLTAGELSVRLDDLSAAGSFFARAEKIDPRSGRAKAGEGAILVRSQRPAEALRYFAQAEQFGLSPAQFASDRGMAYDLLGDPGRAQRDHKLALATRPDAETRRRYALSLGIAGRQEQALNELAPLIRDNDRAAWRTRAFVLAMGGDAAEASRIAQTMMPPGAAAGLRGFFAELPRLTPVDRAFAVHFGETRPGPVRLADARLAPRDAPLALEPLPVRVAAAQPARESRKKRDRRKREEVQVAALIAPRAPDPLPQPPAYQAPLYVPPLAATTPVRDRPLTAGELASLTRAGVRPSSRYSRSAPVATAVPPAVRALTPAEQASLAAATIRPRTPAPVTLATLPPPPRYVAPPVRREVPVALAPSSAPVASVAPPRTVVVAPPPVAVASVASNSVALPTVVAPRPIVVAPPAVAMSVVPNPVPSSIGGPPTQTVATGTAVPLGTAGTPSVIASPAETIAGMPASATLPSAAVPVPPPTPGFSAAPTAPAATLTIAAAEPVRTAPEPSVVALTAPPIAAPVAAVTPGTEAVPPVVAALAPTAVPASEPPVTAAAVATSTPLAPLVAPPPASAIASVAAPPAPTRSRTSGDSVLAKIVADLNVPASELGVGAPAAVATTRRAAAAKLAADRKASDAKAAADKKAVADRKAAAEKKALADKEAAEKKIERSQPRRIWVQVAGGANESDLAKAWRAAQAKAPALAGKQGWSTPLRATNRVLSGPFQTDAEARAHVNQLAKAGVSAFTFTSEPGQKITRLAAK